MLPSGYTAMMAVDCNQYRYIDTGIYTKHTMSVQIGFTNARTGGYIFGARNTNSNGSAGQLGLYIGTTGTADYFCWGSARVSQTMPSMSMTHWNFSCQKYEGVLCADGIYVSELTGNSSTTFTGTRPIYVGAFNNAGTATATGSSIYGFKLWDGDDLVMDLAPVYEESTGTAGMYDLVNNQFFPSATANAFNTGVLIQSASNVGGRAYFKTLEFGLVDKIRSRTKSENSYAYVTAVAKAENGYAFSRWEENGNVLSYDEEYTFAPTGATTLNAVFMRATDQTQDNDYKAIVLPYNEQLGSDSRHNATYLNILDFSINEDAMQKATSTLTCKEIPSNLRINVPIILFNPKNRIIYYGAIESIKGNVLTCRDPLYLYDDDYIIRTDMYNEHYNVLNYMARITNTENEKTRAVNPIWPSTDTVTVDPNVLQTEPMLPITENKIENAEKLFFDLFNDYGVLMEYSFYKLKYQSSETWRLGMKPITPKQYGRVYIGDNVENVQNVSVTTQEADTTILLIYNASGSDLRATFGMKKDGTIAQTGSNNNDFIFKDVYKQKIIMSDDNLRTLAKENLANSYYQHKIDFDLAIDGLITMDDIKIGRDISFYYQDKVYDSIITARSYSKNSNVMHVTLGVVRNTLTAKLNLRKVKQ